MMTQRRLVKAAVVACERWLARGLRVDARRCVEYERYYRREGELRAIHPMFAQIERVLLCCAILALFDYFPLFLLRTRAVVPRQTPPMNHGHALLCVESPRVFVSVYHAVQNAGIIQQAGQARVGAAV